MIKKSRQNFAVAQMAQNQSEDNVDILCWYDFEYDKTGDGLFNA